MPNHEYLNYPYIPNRQNKKQGRPTHREYLHRIAYTEMVRDYDSDNKLDITIYRFTADIDF